MVWLTGCVVMRGAVLVLPVPAVKSIVSVGAIAPSLEAKRTAGPSSACATIIHQNLAPPLSPRACTSAPSPAPKKVAVREPPLMRCDALAVAEKSPPGLVQLEPAVPKNRAFQVASPLAACAPPPPPEAGVDEPSPQSAERRCNSTVLELAASGVLMPKLTVTELTVEPAGIWPAMLKATKLRRTREPPFGPLLPAKRNAPAPLLKSASPLPKIVVSLLGRSVAVAAKRPGETRSASNAPKTKHRR